MLVQSALPPLGSSALVLAVFPLARYHLSVPTWSLPSEARRLAVTLSEGNSELSRIRVFQSSVSKASLGGTTPTFSMPATNLSVYMII